MRVLALLAIVVLTAGVAACGSDDGDGSGDGQGADEQEIRASIDTMQKALNERDWTTVCDSISKQATAQFKQAEGHKTCEAAVADVLTDDPTGKDATEEPKSVSITSIEIKGNQAVVLGTQPRRDGPQQAQLVKEGDVWKLSGWFTN